MRHDEVDNWSTELANNESGNTVNLTEGGKRFPPRTDESDAAARRVLQAMADADIGKRVIGAATALLHRNGTFSVGLSGDNEVVNSKIALLNSLPSDKRLPESE